MCTGYEDEMSTIDIDCSHQHSDDHFEGNESEDENEEIIYYIM